MKNRFAQLTSKPFFRRIKDLATFNQINELPHEQYTTNIIVTISVANLLISFFLIFYGIYTTFINQMGDSDNRVLALIVLPILFIGANVSVLQRLRQGEKQQAGRILTLGGLILIIIAIFYTGGLYSSANLGLLFMFVTGIMLVDFKIMRIIYVCILGFFLFLFAIEVNGYLPEVIDKDLPLRIIALSTAISGLLFVVAYHKFALFESRRRMALLEAEQERYLVQQELTQNLAHDLRTPISILKTKMYLIKRYAEKDMPIASKLDELETVANNMNVMIEDLLALTLLDKDMVLATGTSILVEDMVSECIESLRSYATTYNIRITLESSSPRSVAIYGNRKQLIRTFTNLIENAVHYGKVDGYVNICLHNYADHVTICVEDDGIGIAPENHEKVFDRFFRVNPARTSDGRQGTGIGLSIVQKIIEAHGGKISLESELGHGTKFMVSLPRHAETA